LEIDWQLKLVFLLILLFLSAFFSGSEVALFSIDRRKLKNKLQGNQIIDRYLINLTDHPRRLLVTILVGNTIVNVAASIVAVTLALDIHSNSNLSEKLVITLQIIILTALIIIFSELTPKLWASKNPYSFSRMIAFPLYWFSVVLYPVAETLTELVRLSVQKFKPDKSKSAISQEEITELAGIGHELGTLEEEEHGIIQSIVGFKSVSVYEVMTPRVDMTVVSVDTGLDELIEIIKSSGFSRIPLYKDNLDEIVGIIYAKDILPFLKSKELNKKIDLPSIARKAMFIPESKMINDLMHEFQREKMHIAIVVDEYGGTSGLITLEDIIEEIVGEIRDEYDKEENPVVKIDDYRYLVLGKVSVEELNELFNTKIISEDEDFETLGGFVLNQAGHIPKEGYNFNIENYKFTVKDVSKKRINKVLIEKLHGE
jgi:putative hemolysin